MEFNTILQGDVLEVLKTLPNDCFDAVITDPPYGLEFMGKERDSFKDTGKSSLLQGIKEEGIQGCESLEDKSIEIQQPHNSKSLEERYSMTSKNNHPTVKPINLMEYLIKMVTKEGQVVLDPFAGSGSTLIACRKLNRNFVGIEKEKEYIKIIEKRLKLYLEQKRFSDYAA